MAWWWTRGHCWRKLTLCARKASPVSPDNLKIAHNATLILPLHQELDAARESANSGVRIGTTKRGIGPAYEDKVGRRALRVADLADPDTLADKIDHLLRHHNALRRGLDLAPYDAAALLEKLKAVAPQITPYAAPVWRLLNEARRITYCSVGRASGH